MLNNNRYSTNIFSKLYLPCLCWQYPGLYLQTKPVSKLHSSISNKLNIQSQNHPFPWPKVFLMPLFFLSLNITIHCILPILSPNLNASWIYLRIFLSADTTLSQATVVTTWVTPMDRLVSWLSVLHLLIYSPYTGQADFSGTWIWVYHSPLKSLKIHPGDLRIKNNSLIWLLKTLPDLILA